MQIETQIRRFKNKIEKYFESEEFYNFVKNNTSEDFMRDFFPLFKTYMMGGKCIRGYLIWLGYKICLKGKINHLNDIVKIAAAYEIFEASILAQDDIIDNGRTRRGIPSMYVKLGDSHLSKSLTMTIADVGFFISNLILQNVHFDAKTVLKATKIQNEIYLKTGCGQILDMQLSVSENYTEEDVLKMYKQKTAHYSIIGPMLIGATFANANKKQIENIKGFGEKLGLLFQIRDDYLGIFGNEEEMGKTQCVDIIEGKKTILTAHFKSVCSLEQQKIFNEYYGKQVSGQQQKIVKLFEDTKTKDYVNLKSEQLSNEAINLLNAACFKETHKKTIFQFVNFLLKRKK